MSILISNYPFFAYNRLTLKLHSKNITYYLLDFSVILQLNYKLPFWLTQLHAWE